MSDFKLVAEYPAVPKGVVISVTDTNRYEHLGDLYKDFAYMVDHVNGIYRRKSLWNRIVDFFKGYRPKKMLEVVSTDGLSSMEKLELANKGLRWS